MLLQFLNIISDCTSLSWNIQNKTEIVQKWNLKLEKELYLHYSVFLHPWLSFRLAKQSLETITILVFCLPLDFWSLMQKGLTLLRQTLIIHSASQISRSRLCKSQIQNPNYNIFIILRNIHQKKFSQKFWKPHVTHTHIPFQIRFLWLIHILKITQVIFT